MTERQTIARLGRIVLLAATLALCSAQPAVGAASPTTLAPPFASKHVVVSGGASGDAGIISGDVGAYVLADIPFTDSATTVADVMDRLYTSWTATFTGTAVFTARFRLTGNLDVSVQASGAPSPSGDSAQATATVKGAIQVSGPGKVKTTSAVLQSVSAYCT